ncbi:TetR/AcrR family transcriptional regulator [Clostridium sp. Marseille-P299]|uniref:TetR/AcrR family transcriptional regulator n=1 Tax=Clostridium sp. Marseille-P299 TaxID=1805477 RepID=UPI000AE406E8
MCINIAATSKEEILEISRKLVIEKGLSAVNMRMVAKECGVAVGSIYNYFPSKSDLISATIENVWKDIFHMSGKNFEFQSFIDCLSWLFESIQEGRKRYPEFFTIHSMSFASEDKMKGRQMMERYFGHIKENLLLILKKDCNVRPEAFNEVLTPTIYVDYVFTLFISILMEKQDNCDALLELVKHSIY